LQSHCQLSSNNNDAILINTNMNVVMSEIIHVHLIVFHLSLPNLAPFFLVLNSSNAVLSSMGFFLKPNPTKGLCLLHKQNYPPLSFMFDILALRCR
jgi:hypothetical protein